MCPPCGYVVRSTWCVVMGWPVARGLWPVETPCSVLDSLAVGEGLKPSPTFQRLRVSDNRTSASLSAWTADLGRRDQPRPGNRENQLVARSLWLVVTFRRLWFVVYDDSTPAARGLQHSKAPSLGGGPGWGFLKLARGSWLVVCGNTAIGCLAL